MCATCACATLRARSAPSAPPRRCSPGRRDVGRRAHAIIPPRRLLEFDTNKDGMLDCDELQPALDSLGLNVDREQCEKIVSKVHTSITTDGPPCEPTCRASRCVVSTSRTEQFDFDMNGEFQNQFLLILVCLHATSPDFSSE